MPSLTQLRAVEQFVLLRANAHRWGTGFVHLIDAMNDETWCGRLLGGCPGTKFYGPQSSVTCKNCLRSIEARAKAEERQRELQRLEQKRAADNRGWWGGYNAYLLTQTWRDKRAMVMRRAAGICEGCGCERATQVHHREYPRDCHPGSDDWVRREKLFTLVAVCADCHDDLHQRPR